MLVAKTQSALSESLIKENQKLEAGHEFRETHRAEAGNTTTRKPRSPASRKTPPEQTNIAEASRPRKEKPDRISEPFRWRNQAPKQAAKLEQTNIEKRARACQKTKKY